MAPTSAEPLFCDLADEMQSKVESYRAGWSMMQGYTTVSIDALARWADGMERAALLIEGPPE